MFQIFLSKERNSSSSPSFVFNHILMRRNQPYCSIADGYQHIILKSEGVRDLNLCPMNWPGVYGFAVQRFL